MELVLLGIVLIIVGLLLIGMALFGIPKTKSRETSIAGIILIGPIPIIFGKNVKAAWLIILAVMALLLTVSMLIVMGAVYGG